MTAHEPPASLRIDRWLWFARKVKSRTLAASLIENGKLRINGEKITRPAHPVSPGDVVTLVIRGHVSVMRILDTGKRRGPASEAQSLYETLES